MGDHECALDYRGPERRSGDDRRTDCPYHSGHETMLNNLKDKQKTMCHNLEVVKLEVDRKTSQKLFYTTAAGVIILVISILTFQWTIYERVVEIGLSHAETMGEIKVEIEKVNSSIDNEKDINRLRVNQLDSVMKSHLVNAEKEYAEIRATIREVANTLQQMIKERRQ